MGAASCDQVYFLHTMLNQSFAPTNDMKIHLKTVLTLAGFETNETILSIFSPSKQINPFEIIFLNYKNNGAFLKRTLGDNAG